MTRPGAPLYSSWISDLAPCWKCGARIGDPCKATFGPYEGEPVRPHTNRTYMATAVQKQEAFNSGHIVHPDGWTTGNVLDDCLRPLVKEVVGRKEWEDDHPDGHPPIPAGTPHYKWKPFVGGFKRSLTKPTLQNGILFWPET